jgi:cell division protein FtsA
MKGIVTAVEFGSSKIACITGIKRSFGRFELLYTASNPYAGFRKGNWLQKDAIGYGVSETLRKTQGELGTKIKSAYMGIPGEFIQLVRSSAEADIPSKTGKISENELATLKENAIIHEKPVNMTVQKSYPVYYATDNNGVSVDPADIRAARIRCEYIHIYTDDIILKDMQAVCDTIGIHVDSFICVPCALPKLVTDERDASLKIFVDVGYYVTDISLVLGHKLILHKVLELGGYHLTNDLSICLRLPLEEAEHLKRRILLGSAKASTSGEKERENSSRTESIGGSARDIMMARLEEMCELIDNVLSQSHLPNNKDTVVYLTGGGVSMITGIAKIFQTMLDKPVKILDTGMRRNDSAC